jgi:hypothetical protein
MMAEKSSPEDTSLGLFFARFFLLESENSSLGKFFAEDDNSQKLRRQFESNKKNECHEPKNKYSPQF